MYQKYDGISYYEDKKVQIISLPYISNELGFKMTIILPNSKYSSPLDYLKNENISLSEIDSKLYYTKNVHLYLPKFKYDFKIEKLKEILQEMGVNQLFLIMQILIFLTKMLMLL